ncbi:glycosyltransferase family 4 protein [Jatrophihabitans telluris]|uniref:Glycosyltransferase family 4 protein n=1 Tax=Jatrophihabitans telluris TaxID=2038343 RepID=A0ABY4QZJ7_9ACTN|nr:glycosyltransferase family 4 protein [Jatrophihabitans telluris]UQX89029.1 glycosyltransferase family 4 protein [Jatrophihabitans telluris]
MTAGMRIAIIASARFPIRQPFAGGLEAHTWSLAEGLRRRGHQVTLFAEAADRALSVASVRSRWPEISVAASRDPSAAPKAFLDEHHAYLSVMMRLIDTAEGQFDVVHNNSLHHLPVAMAPAVPVPMITTLHTPPIPWLESAIQISADPGTFVAVSHHTARSWRHVVPEAEVIHNGVDLARWPVGPGGNALVWSGRVVPEKGPELAIAAARRAGLPLTIVGACPYPEYFETAIAPLLGDGITYLGHLRSAELADLLGRSGACIVSPRWDEPYGLVAAEALACGTPVAAFARGGLPEVVGPDSGVLVPADDVDALAEAAVTAMSLSRTAARARAESFCSVERMLDRYEGLYTRLTSRLAA